MLTISLNKVVTIQKELPNHKTVVFTCNYKDLQKHLKNENEITVKYCFGDLKRRRNQLQKLGYKLKETIFYNDHTLHGQIKEVWKK